MAGTYAQIRQGLATLIDPIVDWQVSAYALGSPTPPCIHIFPGAGGEEIEYDLAMARGLDSEYFTVQAMVALTADVGSQKKLDTLLDSAGATSVKAAVEADRTLGGVVKSLQVTKTSGYRQAATPQGLPVIAVDWTVKILN